MLALAASACFGAAIFGYWTWFQRLGYPDEALDAIATAVAWIALAALCAAPATQSARAPGAIP
jgi:hypothetical protein